MPAFDVLILERPTKKEAEEGVSERIVFGPKTIVARDEQSAGIAAVMDGGTAVQVDAQRMEVLVRPFA